MSIFDTLAESGVTQEDLEKAASARLFAEAAAAEGIDLSELTEDQAEELYEFWANGGEEKVAGADEFVAAAAAEGIDLNELTEEQVGELYEFWANGGEEKTASAEDMLAEAAVKEASAKLAEAEYIGRYMARVYADELNKLAAEDSYSQAVTQAMPSRAATQVIPAAKRYGQRGAAKARNVLRILKEHKGKTLGAAGGAAVAGGLGYGAKKLYDAKKSEGGEKQSSIDALIEERALELLKEAAESEKEEKKHTKYPVLKSTAVGGGVAGLAGGATGLAIGHKVKKILAEGAKHAPGAGLSGVAKAPIRRQAALMGAAAAIPTGLTYGLAHGIGRRHGRKDMEKESSIDEIIEARALEMLEEAQVEAEIDEAALELLRENGYDV